MIENIDRLKKPILDLIESEYITDRVDVFFNCGLSMKDIDTEVDKILNELDEKYGLDYFYMFKEESKLINKRFRTNKENWINQLLEDKNEVFQKESKRVKFKFNFCEESAMEKFKNNNAEEWIEREKEKVLEWKDDNKSFLIDFPYLSSDAIRSINAALTNDLNKIILSFVEEKVGEIKEISKNRDVLMRSLTSLNNPVSDGLFFEMEENNIKDIKIQVDGEYTHIDIYEANEKLTYTSVLDFSEEAFDFLNDSDKRRIVSRLHQKDMEILDVLLSYDPEKVYKRENIIIPIKDIVKNVFSSENSRSYRYSEYSLHKLKMLSFFINDKEKNTQHSFSLLNSVKTYYDEEKGLRMGEVEISNKLYRDIIEGRTIKLFKKSIDSLKSNFSKGIVFILQARRINKLISEKEPNKTYKRKDRVEELDIGFFRQVVYMNENYYRNVKKIERALNELVKENLIIESYERELDIFKVKYLPIGKKEMSELVGNPGEVIESLSDTLADQGEEIKKN